MLSRSRCLRSSAFSELQLVGSRWTRILAKSSMQDVGPPHVQAHLATPCITIIPTLHVASLKFYDRVLEYIQQAVRRNPDTIILLEGICDSNEAETQQMAEYLQIAMNDELRDTMVEKANANNLYSPNVMQQICAELALDYHTLQRHESTIRLQECYLKPKMAALCGKNLRNNADLDMREVQRLLEEEAVRLAATGGSLPTSVSVSEIGKFPIVRKNRERKVASVARLQCERWMAEEIEGEVIVPWGFYHTQAIMHYILEANTGMGDKVTEGKSAGKGNEGREDPRAQTTRYVRPSLVFVEADELVAKVPFDVPKEVIEASTRVDTPARTAAGGSGVADNSKG